jgi:hypothetical protein
VTIDDIPLWLLFVGTTLLIVAAIEAGNQIGRFARRRSEDEKEATVSAVSGTVLALLAFILAFTFGLVANRYDTRRELVRDQANAVRAAFTQADFLPEPSRSQSKALYQTYVPLVMQASNSDNSDNIQSSIEQAHTIQAQLWDMAVANVRAGDNSDISANYTQSITEMSNVLATRVAVSVQSRIPTGIWLVLYVLIGFGMIEMGYQTAISESRRSWSMILMALSFSVVIIMIAALDDPERGFLPVSQQPLIDVQTEMQSAATP